MPQSSYIGNIVKPAYSARHAHHHETQNNTPRQAGDLSFPCLVFFYGIYFMLINFYLYFTGHTLHQRLGDMVEVGGQ